MTTILALTAAVLLLIVALALASARISILVGRVRRLEREVDCNAAHARTTMREISGDLKKANAQLGSIRVTLEQRRRRRDDPTRQPLRTRPGVILTCTKCGRPWLGALVGSPFCGTCQRAAMGQPGPEQFPGF